MQITRKIAEVPLFSGLPAEHLRELAGIAVDRVYRKGEIVFSEGEKAKGFFVLLSGRVKIFKLSPEGKEQILHIFDPGEPFGEVPVFTGKNFPANAETMEKSRTLFFPRDAFIELVRKTPSIALNMLAILSMRLRKFTLLIEDLSLKEVPGRLAAYLVYLSEEKQGSEDLELSITKGQLAGLLGTIPETLSRILTRMSNQGLILSKGPRIRILNREALKDLAETGRIV